MANAKVDCKVVLLGKEYGGKTSLVERFVHGKFQDGNGTYQNVSIYLFLYVCHFFRRYNIEVLTHRYYCQIGYPLSLPELNQFYSSVSGHSSYSFRCLN